MLTPAGLQELHQTAMSHADKIMLTDAPLLYTPGQVTLNFVIYGIITI
jgi:hypothetical protein